MYECIISWRSRVVCSRWKKKYTSKTSGEKKLKKKIQSTKELRIYFVDINAIDCAPVSISKHLIRLKYSTEMTINFRRYVWVYIMEKK